MTMRPSRKLCYDAFEMESDGAMAEVVNLDALIPREDFLSPDDPSMGAAGESGKASASVTDLSMGESFFSTLRKPDFQRETAAWSPIMVKEFVKAFIHDDLIPSVICWQSAARLTFVIDGAHRLSAIIAWILNDYGDGDLSQKQYGYNIPKDQRDIAQKTRELIEQEIGSYKSFRAGTQFPGSVPAVAKHVRALAHSKIPLLWVKGNDSQKAERAFFTINQSAVEIDPTELKILNARAKPNAIAARAIVRNASGHKYWNAFSSEGQDTIESQSKAIYSMLYHPPISRDERPRTEELPVAGHGYGTQTLPLIFDFVNIANSIPVVDPSKKKGRLTVVTQEKPNEADTVKITKNTISLCRKITGVHASSLGLHPAVYFYSANGRHQPTTVLSIALLLSKMKSSDDFILFSTRRKAFENFLIGHKMHINQLTVRYGSMAKGYGQINEYYEFILNCISQDLGEVSIETALRSHERFQFLVKEKPSVSKQARNFTSDAKQVKLMSDVLSSAFVCNVCGARIDKKSMHLDHILDKKFDGAADIDNSQWLHPFCDSTYKDYVRREALSNVGA